MNLMSLIADAVALANPDDTVHGGHLIPPTASHNRAKPT